MAFRKHLLVVANRTVDAPALISALERRAGEGPVRVTLLAPTTWSERDEARRRVDDAIAKLRAADMEAEGVLGDADPIVAVQETWHPGRFDEVIVSTLASPVSRWMQIDLPRRVARLTDCIVHHVETGPAPEEIVRPPAQPAPPRRPMLESVLSLMRTSTRGGSA